MRGRTKIAIVLALAGLIAGVTPVLASSSGQGLKPITGYTGKIENRVLSDTASGRETSIVINLTQQADLSAAYGMRDQDAQGWYVYRTLKRDGGQDAGADQGAAQGAGRVVQVVLGCEHDRHASRRPRSGQQPCRSARRQGHRVERAVELARGRPGGNCRVLLRLGVDDRGAGPGQPGSHRARREPGQGPERLGAWLQRHRDRHRQPGHRHALDAQRAQAELPRLERFSRRPQLQLAGRDPHPGGGNPAGSTTRRPATTTSTARTRPAPPSGDDGAGNQIGVAPGAKWIGCRNMDQGVGTPATYTECFQFFIAPTDLNGQNPNPTLRPHVMNNSWGCPPSEGCAAEHAARRSSRTRRLRASSWRSPRGTPGRAAARSTIRPRSTRRPTRRAR